MIVDVHTHTPTHAGPVPKAEEVWNTLGRPDEPVRVTCSWAEYNDEFDAAGVDVSLVFNIARRVNDAVAGTDMLRIPEQAIEDIINRDALQILGVARP
jgi:uncharacterized protein